MKTLKFGKNKKVCIEDRHGLEVAAVWADGKVMATYTVCFVTKTLTYGSQQNAETRALMFDEFVEHGYLPKHRAIATAVHKDIAASPTAVRKQHYGDR